MMECYPRGTLLILGLALILITPENAFGFWRIWQERVTPSQPSFPISSSFKALREGSCGDTAAISHFGETAFMRGELDKSTFPKEFIQTVTAAYTADQVDQAQSLLAPYLTAENPAVRSAAKIAMAFITLRLEGITGASQTYVIELLSNDFSLAGNADRPYLLATLALGRRDWPKARQFAAEALNISPGYYNAQVIDSLAALEELSQQSITNRTCEAIINDFEQALIPLLALGACPTHVAHVNLAAERFLPEHASYGDSEELGFIRRILLAYVARNDRVGRALIDQYKERKTVGRCARELKNLFNPTSGEQSDGH